MDGGPLPGPISKAGGEWPVDWVRARHDARLALNAIDWSKGEIVLWVPGTSNHKIHEGFEAAVRESWIDGGVSLSRVEYEASWNMRPSTATGIATLRLILAGIAAHGGTHRVMLAGESQGAWLIGEALSDPRLRRVVHRAVLFGHPFVAAHHFDDGHDPGVLEINNAGDQVSAPIKGDVAAGLDAMVAIRTLNVGGLGTVAKALSQNPEHGVMILKSLAGGIFRGLVKDPHNYTGEMSRAVEWLRFGSTGDRAADDMIAAPARAVRSLRVRPRPAT